MNSPSEKFKTVIKEGVSKILKENSFKKKGLHFSKDVGEVIYTFNVQKNRNNSSSEISFTFNTGFFSKVFWLSKIGGNEKETPSFPKEYDSMCRLRIGQLKYDFDYWYEVDELKITSQIIKELRSDIDKYILPHFYSISNTNDLIKYLEKNRTKPGYEYCLFTLLIEKNEEEKSQKSLDNLFSTSHERHFENYEKYAKTYGLKINKADNKI